MVQVARHGHEYFHAKINSDGGIKINDFLRQKHVKNLGIDFVRVVDIIRTETEHGKMRFEIFKYDNKGEMYFRDTQGHTMPHIQDEEALTPLTEDNWPRNQFKMHEVIHGTDIRHQYAIEQHGLIAGGMQVSPRPGIPSSHPYV